MDHGLFNIAFLAEMNFCLVIKLAAGPGPYIFDIDICRQLVGPCPGCFLLFFRGSARKGPQLFSPQIKVEYIGYLVTDCSFAQVLNQSDDTQRRCIQAVTQDSLAEFRHGKPEHEAEQDEHHYQLDKGVAPGIAGFFFKTGQGKT